jgi:hypothetical protein
MVFDYLRKHGSTQPESSPTVWASQKKTDIAAHQAFALAPERQTIC